ncbi:TPA: hypothetical protein R1765_001946 [Campylobacter coli]|nr:hypothetical protein [Campylobacter coli]
MSKNIADKIMKERESQYGDYLSNMVLIKGLEDFIKVTYKGKNSLLADSICSFTQTMVLLKTVRSLSATGSSYDDCLIDLLNYIKLSKEALLKINKKMVIILDEDVFNPHILNTDPNDFKSLKFILKKEFLKDLSNVINLKIYKKFIERN